MKKIYFTDDLGNETHVEVEDENDRMEGGFEEWLEEQRRIENED